MTYVKHNTILSVDKYLTIPYVIIQYASNLLFIFSTSSDTKISECRLASMQSGKNNMLIAHNISYIPFIVISLFSIINNIL